MVRNTILPWIVARVSWGFYMSMEQRFRAFPCKAICFGSANRLYHHVKALLERQSSCRFIIFDFRLVTGIDSSAASAQRNRELIADFDYETISRLDLP
jgi:hypothetical protein